MKLETKVTIWAVLIPAVITIAALAPFPQGIKIIGDLVFNERAAPLTTPVAGTGTFYVKNTVPSTPVFVDDTGAETTLGAGGGGGGGDPTYGSDAGASDDSVFVDASGDVGIGTVTPTENIHIYATDNAPRIALQYYNVATATAAAYPGTATGTTPGTTNVWGTPSNVGASDDVRSGSLDIFGSGTDFSQSLKTVLYGFAIPLTATITGVEVDVEGSMTGTAIEYGAYLVRAGTITTGTNRSTGAAWSSTEAIHTFGSNVDDWGGITPAEVNDTGFGFAFRVEFPGTGTCYIDSIQITIHYSDVGGDYIWTSGPDILDGAYTIRASATDMLRLNYTTGDAEFTGIVDANGYKQDGVLYDLSAIGSGGGDVTGPASSTDNAIARFDSTTGKIIQNSAVLIADTTGNITTSGTFDGRDVSTDGAKLDGIAPGATANTGTVTSVAVSGTDGVEVDSGSPVTTSGTIQLGINPFTLYDVMWTGAAAPSGGIASTDTLLISDVSASGLMAEVAVSSFMLSATGTDNAIMKKIGATGQIEQTAILIDDSNNITGSGTINGHAVPTGSGDFLATDSPQTVTNKRITKRTTVVSGGLTVDADTYDRVVITGITSSPVSIANPTGTHLHGDLLEFHINQNATSTISWGTHFKAGTDWSGTIPTLTATADAWDYYLFEWNNYETEYHLLACSQGN